MFALRNASRLFPLLLAVILVLLTLWLEYLLAMLPAGRDPVNRGTVEYMAFDFIGTSFDANGRIDRHAFGKSMWQYPEDKRVFFTDSTLEQYSLGRKDLSIFTTSGLYNNDTGIAFLDGKVHARREPSAQHPLPATLDTTRLTVDTRKRTADTLAPAIYVEGGNRIDTVGFHYADATQQYKLKSRVRMTYAPPKSE